MAISAKETLLGVTAPELLVARHVLLGGDGLETDQAMPGCFPAAWRLLCRNRSASDFGIAAEAGKKARNEESQSRPLGLPGSPATDDQPRVRPPVSVKAAGECPTPANEAASSASRIPHQLPHRPPAAPACPTALPSQPAPAPTTWGAGTKPSSTRTHLISPLSSTHANPSTDLKFTSPFQPRAATTPSLSPASAALRNRLPSRLVLPIW